MNINQIKVISKLFHGVSDAYPSSTPFVDMVADMRSKSEYRFQIARGKAERLNVHNNFEAFKEFMASK